VTVAVKLASEPALTVNEEICEMRLGGAFTVTVNVPLLTFPTASVAVTVTVVVPTGNTVPLAGEYVMVGLPRLSVTLAPPNVTLAPLTDVALALRFPTLTTGAAVSNTPALESVPPCTLTMSELQARRNPPLP